MVRHPPDPFRSGCLTTVYEFTQLRHVLSAAQLTDGGPLKSLDAALDVKFRTFIIDGVAVASLPMPEPAVPPSSAELDDLLLPLAAQLIWWQPADVSLRNTDRVDRPGS